MASRKKKRKGPEGAVKDLTEVFLTNLDAWFMMPVSNGMGTHGIPDFIACVPVTITPDMVGKTIGVFTGIETKAAGRREEKNRGASGLQIKNLREISKSYGIAAIVDGEEDLNQIKEVLSGNEDHRQTFSRKPTRS